MNTSKDEFNKERHEAQFWVFFMVLAFCCIISIPLTMFANSINKGVLLTEMVRRGEGVDPVSAACALEMGALTKEQCATREMIIASKATYSFTKEPKVAK